MHPDGKTIETAADAYQAILRHLPGELDCAQRELPADVADLSLRLHLQP